MQNTLNTVGNALHVINYLGPYSRSCPLTWALTIARCFQGFSMKCGLQTDRKSNRPLQAVGCISGRHRYDYNQLQEFCLISELFQVQSAVYLRYVARSRSPWQVFLLRLIHFFSYAIRNVCFYYSHYFQMPSEKRFLFMRFQMVTIVQNTLLSPALLTS